MTRENDGGPAFPETYWDHNLEGITAREQYPGMTLRDWFAGMALQGLISTSKTINGKSDLSETDYASTAYIVADAMIAEREKETTADKSG